MQLFTIGDSISQGFMSGAAARTDLAYSTLIAGCMGLEAGYRYPQWGANGLPINMEVILRSLANKYGDNVNPLEWAFALRTANRIIEDAEDYYERGAGGKDTPYTESGGEKSEYFHNVAFQGCDVADAWALTPSLCKEMIPEDGERDAFLPFSGPSAAYYRTALKVLNPSLAREHDERSQVGWLAEHARKEGVENLILWLGANNALGTVITLNINQTPNDPNRRPHTMSHPERATNNWNLWHPADFEAEYRELLRRVDAAMEGNGDEHDNWKVFVGNVPLVTIAPLAKGVGPVMEIERNGKKSVYFKYYTYFFFEENDVREKDIAYLTLEEALHIDDCIRAYNQTISDVLDEQNTRHGTERYHLVDTCGVLETLAFKRNAGQIGYDFPAHFEFVYPRVNSKYYHADRRGRLRQGGLFGLDGVHPTAIGQGIVAHEFLKVMKKSGVTVDGGLDWPAIIARDTLYSKPIRIMHELYNKDWLAKYLIERFVSGTQPR
ncbi:hypothetical protein BH18ACT10_BH18ACT10_11630 [soil metagenome]